MGKSGAGRLWSSRTLAKIFTRSTFTLILPRCASASSGRLIGCAGVGTIAGVGALASAEEEFEGGFGFCAQGGRSGFS